MPEAKPFLESCIEGDVLMLTILRQQIEGEEVAAGLKEELQDAVARSGLHKVVLDLQHTRYVSSIAFWPLLNLKRQLADDPAKHGRLILCGLTGAVLEVFTTTKMISSSGSLNAPFELAPDRESAVAMLAPLPSP
jgi:anti-anti-sigma regulatory factor